MVEEPFGTQLRRGQFNTQTVSVIDFDELSMDPVLASGPISNDKRLDLSV